jgi:hypothetical protein
MVHPFLQYVPSQVCESFFSLTYKTPWNNRRAYYVFLILGSRKYADLIQVGLPVLPEVGSPGHFELLRGLLRICDEKHEKYNCHSKSNSTLPTRVLDVGDGRSLNFLRLHCSDEGERGDYIALSHCWGKLPPEERAKCCTTLDNIGRRRERIEIEDLPKSFKDAITVTRGLGKRYLWIDAFCIIQEDEDDWKKESKKMETVFSMAYCTVAASSARDSNAGFLNPRPERRYVKMPKNFSDTSLYICEAIDDFHGDVEQSELSQRAWVLQERALSRRTIYFTATQAYWECGIGVQCETLTTMYK